MTAIADSIYGLIKDAARAVIEETAPALVERLVPIVIERVKAELAADNRTAGGALFVSVTSAAKIMSAHPTTVRKLIAEGKLGRFSVEGKIRVKVADIHAYLGREGGAASPTVDLREKTLAILLKKASNDT